MNKQLFFILLLIGSGSTLGIAYGTATVITDSGIITNDLTVLGTCTGCGGGEGSFTTWTLILNQTVNNSDGEYVTDTKVSDIGTVLGTDQGHFFNVIAKNGTILAHGLGANTLYPNSFASKSSTGKYYVFINAQNNTNTYIYKDDVQTQTIGFSSGFATANSLMPGISSNGKYVAIYGEESCFCKERLLLYEGSP